MRLFTTNTPKTSPELVRHSNVAADKVVVGGTNPPEAGGGQGTPPRYLFGHKKYFTKNQYTL